MSEKNTQAEAPSEREALHPAQVAERLQLIESVLLGFKPGMAREDALSAVRSLQTRAALATQQADVGERGDEDAEEEEEEREPLDSEWEEVVLDLAQKHHLGRRIRQIATMRDQAPDVFYTDASYRTHELFSFSEELMQTAREPLVKSISDMTWAMAIIREITRTQQAETFEETVEAVRALATQQPEAMAQQERDREDGK